MHLYPSRQLGLLCAFLLLVMPLQAEIQEVSVRWRNQTCSDTCLALIDKNFKKIPGALDVQVDKGGQATMRWKPLTKFRYSDINLAIRTVGVPLMDIRIKARGMISGSGKKFTLESIGDGTSFILLSPLQIQPNRMASPNNVDSYTIDPPTQKILIDSEMGFQLVTVSGMLLMPERSPPYYLIIESLEGHTAPNPPPSPHLPPQGSKPQPFTPYQGEKTFPHA